MSRGFDRNSEDAFEPEPISDDLEALADDLIAYGLECLGETGHLVPTAGVEDLSGTRVMLTFDDDVTEECMEQARELIAKAGHKNGVVEGLDGKVVRYAIAYDGAVREHENGPYKNALIVEYGERGMTSAYSAYLLYKKAGRAKDFVWTDPAAAGEMSLLV